MVKFGAAILLSASVLPVGGIQMGSQAAAPTDAADATGAAQFQKKPPAKEPTKPEDYKGICRQLPQRASKFNSVPDDWLADLINDVGDFTKKYRQAAQGNTRDINKFNSLYHFASIDIDKMGDEKNRFDVDFSLCDQDSIYVECQQDITMKAQLPPTKDGYLTITKNRHVLDKLESIKEQTRVGLGPNFFLKKPSTIEAPSEEHWADVHFCPDGCTETENHLKFGMIVSKAEIEKEMRLYLDEYMQSYFMELFLKKLSTELGQDKFMNLMNKVENSGLGDMVASVANIAGSAAGAPGAGAAVGMAQKSLTVVAALNPVPSYIDNKWKSLLRVSCYSVKFDTKFK